MYEDLFAYDISGIELPSKIVLSGTSYCDGTYSINRPLSEFSTCEYIISGTGTIYLDGQKYTASAGDTYYLPCNKNQYYFSSSKEPWTKLFFNMTGSLGNLLAKEYGFGTKVVFQNCNIESLMRELLSFKSEKLPPLELQQKSLLQVHKIFMQIHLSTQRNEEISTEIQQLKDFIDVRVTEKLNLEELSASIFRSKNYVINLFKNSLGQTPYDYYITRKMKISQTMLTESNIPIQQISEYLGFDNPQYFSNCFKKRFNCSPREYRLKNRKEKIPH